MTRCYQGQTESCAESQCKGRDSFRSLLSSVLRIKCRYFSVFLVLKKTKLLHFCSNWPRYSIVHLVRCSALCFQGLLLLLTSQHVQLSSDARDRSQVERTLHWAHSPEKRQTAAGCQDLSPGSISWQLTTSTNPGLLNRGETAGGITSSPGEHDAGADCVNPALGGVWNSIGRCRHIDCC